MELCVTKSAFDDEDHSTGINSGYPGSGSPGVLPKGWFDQWLDSVREAPVYYRAFQDGLITLLELAAKGVS